MQADHAIGKFLYRQQLERHGTTSRRNQRNALADDGRNHVNDELINGGGIEKRSDDSSSSHHPDVLALLRTETLSELTDWTIDEFKSRQNFPRRLTREH